MCTVIVLLVGLVRINCTRLSMYEIFCDNEIVIWCFVLHQVLVHVKLIWQHSVMAFMRFVQAFLQ